MIATAEVVVTAVFAVTIAAVVIQEVVVHTATDNSLNSWSKLNNFEDRQLDNFEAVW